MKMKRQIDIMGIVNLTGDSYFAESRCADVPSALSRIELLLEEGADIIDIGACSSRPGSVPVGADVEWGRLMPVLKAVRTEFPEVRISIDTYWSEVVRKAIDVIGGFIVNDISAGDDDPRMLPLVGELGLEYIAMHKRADCDVRSYFMDFARRASDAGVKSWVLDPGFGFAKTPQENLELLSGLSKLKASYEGYEPRILVGISRKSMIYRTLGITPEESLPATQALHMCALMNGADILRVHDVKEARQVADLYNHMA
jgi:dihydropteroate synthase